MPIEIHGASQAPTGGLVPTPRSVPTAMMRAARCRCPACGNGSLTRSFLKIVDHCSACGEALHHQRADDAPAYFTMFVVGHIIVGGILAMEKAFAPPTWVQLAVWLPLTLVLSLALLPVIKGSLVGLQWALRMHGFGAGADPADPLPDPAAALLEAKGRHA